MASNNYVLAEYNGETRKIPGEWSRKSYKNLIREVRSKFNIQFNEIDIKVFDKKNKCYFSIDKSEMREIPNNGRIKVDRGKKGGSSSSNNNIPRSPQSKKKQSPMIPPGVPPYSKADDAKRNGWIKGSKVEIYSEGQSKWMKGEIVRIFTDNEGEWLVIKYAGFRTKEIQRFSNYIRPIQPQQKPKKTPKPKQSKVTNNNNNNKKAAGKEGEKATNKAAKKEKKPPKITTQSKYKRKPRVPEKTQFAENEIYFTNNVRHIKKYIDRACMLLSGSDASHEHAASAQSEDDHDDDDKEDETAQSEEEEDEIHMVDVADLEKPPSKKYNVIHMFAAGRSMGSVVKTTEIVKRIVTGLYQVTTLETVEIKDTWLPTEEGLKEVELVRNVPRLKITLATNPEFVDKEAAGYQEPITNTEFASSIQYHYPDESGRGRGRGRGRQRGRGRGKGGSTSGRGRGRGY